MVTSEQHQDLYFLVRSAILGRQFAIGEGFRTNIASDGSDLAMIKPVGDLTIRDLWDTKVRDRDNTLLWSTKLLAALAAEYQLGNQDAEEIILLALETIGSLYKFSGEFAGYFVRWDPSINTAWFTTKEGDGPYHQNFLIDPDTKAYSYCVPYRDPRHVPKRFIPTLQELLPNSELYNEYIDNEINYFNYCRKWEPSTDEAVGLLTTYSVLFEFVPTDPVRSMVRDQVRKLGNYLADHGYLMVRPEGGLARRGGAGVLSGLEFAFTEAFHRITGEDYSKRTDFVGAMKQAGYWQVLEGPVGRDEVLFTLVVSAVGPFAAAAFSLDGGLLASILASTGTLVIPGAQVLGNVPASMHDALPYVLQALPRSVGVYDHSDCFDMEQEERIGPALANLLGSIPPDLALRLIYDAFSQLPNVALTAKSFMPFIGFSAIADPTSTVATGFLGLMAKNRDLMVPIEVEDLDQVHNCFASAAALLLGAPPAEEERLVELLGAFHDALASHKPGALVVEEFKDDKNMAVTSVRESSREGLDYMAGLALAWLHAKRRADGGDPVQTAGFPTPPPTPTWPSVQVPAEAVDIPLVRAATGQSGPGPVNLFDGALGQNLHRSPVPAFTLPVYPQPMTLTDDQFFPILDTHGDVATNITIGFGDEYEITASPTEKITPPEVLAGETGPNGWDGVVDDARFALYSGIDPVNAHKYALLGRLGGYFFIGEGLSRRPFYPPHPEPVHLYLRVNNDDQTRGAGVGRFLVHVKIWRTESQECANLYGTIRSLTETIKNLEASMHWLDPRKDKTTILEIKADIVAAKKARGRAQARKTQLGCR